MPCLVLAIALFFPRVVIALLYFLSHYFVGVFQTALYPLLGFLFLPLTLLAYTFLTKSGHQADAVYYGVLLIAVLLDLGLLGGGARRRSRG